MHSTVRADLAAERREYENVWGFPVMEVLRRPHVLRFHAPCVLPFCFACLQSEELHSTGLEV